jgi:hypothetical protein
MAGAARAGQNAGMNLRPLAVATVLCLPALPAVAACFTVFDRTDRVVYQSTQPPIDVSGSISAEMARAFPPGHHLLLTSEGYCSGVLEPGAIGGGPSLAPRASAASRAVALADAARNRSRDPFESGYTGGWAGSVVETAPGAAPARGTAERPARRR